MDRDDTGGAPSLEGTTHAHAPSTDKHPPITYRLGVTSTPGAAMIELRHDRIRATIDPLAGGRIASLKVDGFELLVDHASSPLGWGAYPMVPFAGRIRRGRFSFDGTDYELPATLGPHAIHGYGHVNPWTVVGAPTAEQATIEIPLPEPWPFGGRAVQIFSIGPDRLTVQFEVHAEQPMPVTVGWHPWFRRLTDDGGQTVGPVVLDFDAEHQYVRDDDGMATGELIAPTDGPWDDCFTGLGAAPVLSWPGGPSIRIEHDNDHLVVYTEPEHAICVEPQTGPPDAATLMPRIVTADAPLVATMAYVAV